LISILWNEASLNPIISTE